MLFCLKSDDEDGVNVIVIFNFFCMKKNILIIGASSGIGFGLASILSNSHNVFAMSRSRGKLAELDTVSWLPFDVMAPEYDFSPVPGEIHGWFTVPEA